MDSSLFSCLVCMGLHHNTHDKNACHFTSHSRTCQKIRCILTFQRSIIGCARFRSHGAKCQGQGLEFMGSVEINASKKIECVILQKVMYPCMWCLLSKVKIILVIIISRVWTKVTDYVKPFARKILKYWNCEKLKSITIPNTTQAHENSTIFLWWGYNDNFCCWHDTILHCPWNMTIQRRSIHLFCSPSQEWLWGHGHDVIFLIYPDQSNHNYEVAIETSASKRTFPKTLRSTVAPLWKPISIKAIKRTILDPATLILRSDTV